MNKKPNVQFDIVAVSQRIDTARRLLDYGKSDFAKQVLNVTRVSYWSIIKESRPPLSWIFLLAEKFDISLRWLIFGEGEIFNKRKNDV